MPVRPPRICGCGKVVPSGQRCRCERQRDQLRKRLHDAKRPSARARGYDTAWEKARAEFLKAHPRCAYPGCTEAATVVDHVIPHKGSKRLFWNRANWQSLCAHHHNVAKQSKERIAAYEARAKR